MHKFFGLLLVIWSFSLLGGCAGMMRSSLNPPDVSLQTFKVLPQQGVGPRFGIGLHIINPNREPLNFFGIYYTVDIEGYKVLSGVSNNLPTVEPYGEADIYLEAGVDLLSGIRLLSSLMNDPRDSFKYGFKAKLDPRGYLPDIIIQEEGEFNLRGG